MTILKNQKIISKKKQYMYRALLILPPSQFQGRKKHSYSKHSSILIHVIQDIPQGTKISTFPSSPNLHELHSICWKKNGRKSVLQNLVSQSEQLH